MLVEAAYVTEPTQAALLATSAFRAAEARAIANGIERYLRTTDPGTGYRVPIQRGFEASGGGAKTHCHDPDTGAH